MDSQAPALPYAAVAWLVASGAAGLAIGMWLGAPLRQQFFLAVFFAGVYGIVFVNGGQRKPAAELDKTQDFGQVAELLAGEKDLSAGSAREWLDQFLRRQQS